MGCFWLSGGWYSEGANQGTWDWQVKNLDLINECFLIFKVDFCNGLVILGLNFVIVGQLLHQSSRIKRQDSVEEGWLTLNLMAVPIYLCFLILNPVLTSFWSFVVFDLNVLVHRWFTYLNSDFKKGGWSPEEDLLLCEVNSFSPALSFLHFSCCKYYPKCFVQVSCFQHGDFYFLILVSILASP